MNSETIEKTLLSDSYVKDIYGGIFSQDQVPKLQFGKAYVINTAPSTEGKNHFSIEFSF